MKFESSKLINKINSTLLDEKRIELYVKREDLVHPIFGGNKFRKLKYNLEYVKENNFKTIITFGGAYSNHIAATAFAGNEFGFKTVGVIRLSSEEKNLSKTLLDAKQNGMILKFVSRDDYRKKYDDSFLNDLRNEFENQFIIPEGGSNELALKGVAELVDEIEIDFDYIIIPIGTGATFFGIASALKPHQTVVGIDVLKRTQLTIEKLHIDLTSNPYYKIATEVDPMQFANCQLPIANFHFGGYAKSTPELNNFCSDFYAQYNIKIEPIYTGKMFYGIFELAKQNYFKAGSTIVALHTGGLQYLISQ